MRAAVVVLLMIGLGAARAGALAAICPPSCDGSCDVGDAAGSPDCPALAPPAPAPTLSGLGLLLGLAAMIAPSACRRAE